LYVLRIFLIELVSLKSFFSGILLQFESYLSDYMFETKLCENISTKIFNY